MTAIAARRFTRCASCRCEFTAPKSRAYCGRRCERNAGVPPRNVDVARMDLDTVIGMAMPWERAVVARLLRKAAADPIAVREFIKPDRCMDKRVLDALRVFVDVLCKVRKEG